MPGAGDFWKFGKDVHELGREFRVKGWGVRFALMLGALGPIVRHSSSAGLCLLRSIA